MTSVASKLAGLDVEVTAVDPLASAYARLLAEAGLEPPIRTRFGTAEDLSCFFADSSFDIVHCQNALDHSFDPLRGIAEMLRVSRPGGNVVLHHHRCEAEHAGYGGFHQYNFDVEHGRFVIWNRQQRIDVATALHIPATIVARLTEEDMAEVVLTKPADSADAPVEAGAAPRLASFMRAMAELFTEDAFARVADGSSYAARAVHRG